MAVTRKSGVNLARALRAGVEFEVERSVKRLLRGQSLDAELRDLRAAIVRMDRRVEALARRLGAGRRRGLRRIGGPGRPPLHVGCKVEGCHADHYALGLCSRHYQQMRRGATALGATAGPRRGRGRAAPRRADTRGRQRMQPGRTSGSRSARTKPGAEASSES